MTDNTPCTLCSHGTSLTLTNRVCLAGLSKAEIQAAVLETERRLAEKHARLEGAVVQVGLTDYCTLFPRVYT